MSEAEEKPISEMGISRRKLLAVSALSALGAHLPAIAWGKGPEVKTPKKNTAPDPMLLPRVLSDRPLNTEAYAASLDPEVTPTAHLFTRNNGIVPEIASGKNLATWTLSIDGLVERPLTLSLKDLQSNFTHYTYQLVLECGGNGRAGYQPAIPGLQFTYGAVGCPQWTGVRLKDVLVAAGVKSKAIYLAYYAHDLHLSLDASKVVISRGFPLRKAWEDTTLIAWALNGEPLPADHGFPARLICPGFPGSASGKWLKRLWIRDVVHDGEKMLGSDYRVPHYPILPGSSVPDSDMDIIEEMPVKSLITFPASGGSYSHKKGPVLLRGFAWCGKGDVAEVHLTYDYGQTWQRAELKKPVNTFAWQRWECALTFPRQGYYEVMARATDKDGVMQPWWWQAGILRAILITQCRELLSPWRRREDDSFFSFLPSAAVDSCTAGLWSSTKRGRIAPGKKPRTGDRYLQWLSFIAIGPAKSYDTRRLGSYFAVDGSKAQADVFFSCSTRADT
jgi:DMSO/TMAO reductase YedYZ molybdopterin-dependent catalytic subunit